MKKVLVVEDDMKMIQIIKKYLEGTYDVESVHFQNYSDDHKVADLVQVNHYDLIIIDISLESHNGFHVGDFLRKGLNSDDIPIIYMSKNKAFLKSFYQNGHPNSYFLPKPFDKPTVRSIAKKMQVY